MKETPHLTIKEWDDDDRPREKMLRHGKKTLSNAELLAILLRSGVADTSAVDVAKQLLSAGGWSLVELSRKTPQELMRIKGVGAAKATGIAAALELGRRLASESSSPEKNVVGNSADVFHIISPRIIDLATEEFWAIYLNNSNRVVGTSRISAGGITQTTVDIRLIFKGAIELNAVALAVAHNHPSGSLKPSREDNLLTEKIAEAGRLLNIRLLDHIIVGIAAQGQTDYYSYRDMGRL